MKNIKKLFFF